MLQKSVWPLESLQALQAAAPHSLRSLEPLLAEPVQDDNHICNLSLLDEKGFTNTEAVAGMQ